MREIMTAPTPDLLARFAAIVGDRFAIRNGDDQHAYVNEPRALYPGRAPLVLRPGSVEEVQAILRLANETRTAVVPQGGNTGLVGGQVPDGSGEQIVLSLNRFDKVRAIDPDNNTIDVDAGVTLQRTREAAERADRLFPLWLPSEGSCTIGGNIASNAGGANTIAYGNMRDLVLGLEVVLADGRLWRNMRHLRKDNTGYDFRGLFAGSEGTLGVVTGAVLKLYPRPRSVSTAFAAVPDPAAALALLHKAQGQGTGTVTAFELIPRIGIEFAVKHDAGSRDPLSTAYSWYVLLDISSNDESGTDAMIETLLGEAAEDGLVLDAVVASSLEQAKMLWRPRETLSEVQGKEGGSIKQDVSVPVSKVPAFLAEAIAAVEAFMPGARCVPFGHMGDGNIHFNVSQPVGGDKAAFLGQWAEVNAVVHKSVKRHNGSISAEHGVGQQKRELLPRYKDPVEMDLMRAAKAMFDPNGILNPGKVI